MKVLPTQTWTCHKPLQVVNQQIKQHCKNLKDLRNYIKKKLGEVIRGGNFGGFKTAPLSLSNLKQLFPLKISSPVNKAYCEKKLKFMYFCIWRCTKKYKFLTCCSRQKLNRGRVQNYIIIYNTKDLGRSWKKTVDEFFLF